MEMLSSSQWTPIHVGAMGNRSKGNRPIRIERGSGPMLRVVTTFPGSDEEITITGSTPNELEERLVVYGEFTDAQALEIIRKVLFRS